MRNHFAKVRKSPLVFAVIVAQSVTQPPHRVLLASIIGCRRFGDAPRSTAGRASSSRALVNHRRYGGRLECSNRCRLANVARCVSSSAQPALAR
jgi:hypothetical protein